MADEPERLPMVSRGRSRKDGAGEAKRRLTVIQDTGEGPERPPWHWIVIGALGSLLSLVPMLMLSQALAKAEMNRLVPGAEPQAAAAYQGLSGSARAWLAAVTIATQLLPVALASFLGGMLVGRFGGEAGGREATAAGLATGALVALIAAPGILAEGQLVGWLLSLLVLVVLGASGGHLGGRLGLRLR